MAGFIKLHRGWRNSDALRSEKPFHEPEAWIWLLENAAWRETARRGVLVPEGHIHFSERSLASAWGWDRKRVRRFIERLSSENMLKKGTNNDPGNAPKTGTSNGTIYSIVNWEKYQKQGSKKGTEIVPGKGTTDDPTQEEERRKEEKKDGGAAFAFFGRTIRLNDRDLQSWQNTYHSISDLTAELQTIDAWWQGQDDPKPKNWFYRTMQMLNRKHQELLRQDGEDPMENFIV